MTLEEFTDIAKIMNSIFSHGNTYMFESKEQVVAWHSCLQDLDAKILGVAIRNLAIKDSHFKPGISDVRREYFNLTAEAGIGEQEAWEMVADAIRNGIYGATEEFEKLPADVQKAVASPAALTEWAMLPSDKVHTVIQSQFKNAYRGVMERKKSDALLGRIGVKSGQFEQIAESLAKRLEMK